ncbi:aminotransferase class III-fold pyridoxal phosphate-dependent enzyme [Phycisphaera mikurensis]|uniref:Adenosylmethionine-8-amino-7-oxononanoate aminotransferase n=1 Tax=Phycisphaera mikurensis (strain NBRC 102666 / KCTC 22515 / FYK2301M01) TaxID=1142394 RepID=I0IBS1_PHYMF|nr:aminotransferase class III-fold pyridoxal phosphate-dependent enzyme [Phycisphaera mikurensis]MBB6442059.1 adenosylmethionine-8-amino-7-oxononanoate aminotransferase [Phycisphaera mikurensis]BAM02709.1 adenosylmethionine-8-amino-7-oxononanoate aminotransferase [Phycisphaera mikurensis NBRC 102666]
MRNAENPDGPRMPPRTALQARDHRVFWHPCAQMHDYEAFPPLEVASASGSVITLADGSGLIDGISSWWCKSLGHRHRGVAAAVAAQAQAYEHVITANTTSPAIVSLCERVLAACNGLGPDRWGPNAPEGKPPGPFGRCFFADNGSTGVEVALKMALQAQQQGGRPERTRLAALGNGYHGETAGAMSVSDLDLYVSPHGPMMVPVTKLPAPEARTGPDDPRWLDASEQWPAVEAALDAVRHNLAAVIYEPVLQAAGGMTLYSPDLLTRLRRWADGNGVYLIADEIAAGFGRLGPMLASHLAPPPDARDRSAGRFAAPDFAVLSKGLSGGYGPMSMVVTTDAVYELFYDRYETGKAFLHSNTFAGHALGVAAAHAALDAYATEGVRENVDAVGARLHAGLLAAAADRPTLTHVRRLGMVAAVDLRRADGGPLDPADRTGYAVYRAAVRGGALLRPLVDTMYLFPPLNTDAATADRLLAVLLGAVDAVLEPTAAG